jgi:hypothetical protein
VFKFSRPVQENSGGVLTVTKHALITVANNSLLFKHIYVTVNLYNQELCIITEFSVIMYNY